MVRHSYKRKAYKTTKSGRRVPKHRRRKWGKSRKASGSQKKLQLQAKRAMKLKHSRGISLKAAWAIVKRECKASPSAWKRWGSHQGDKRFHEGGHYLKSKVIKGRTPTGRRRRSYRPYDTIKKKHIGQKKRKSNYRKRVKSHSKSRR